MKKSWVLIILAVSGLLIGLGFLFLCASAADMQKAGIRIVLAFGLLALGIAGAVWSGIGWRRIGDVEPQRLADRILEMLRQQGKSETTAAELVSFLSAPNANVQTALEILQKRGETQLEQRDDRRIYVFPNLKEGKIVRRCPYCGTEYPVKQAIGRCPNCGGKIELEKT
jgi:Zn finger protein HypA/HybF involved in hydrogenase expression